MRKHHKKKEQARTSFYRDPYRFIKSLFVKEKRGILKLELKEPLRSTFAYNQRHEPATIPDELPPIHPLKHQMDTRPPMWNAVLNTGKQARTASAPGPNNIPYRLYKNTLGVQQHLWKLMNMAWEKKN